jgi:hypothetical protein
MTFWKKQNYKDSEKMGGCQGFEGKRRSSVGKT